MKCNNVCYMFMFVFQDAINARLDLNCFLMTFQFDEEQDIFKII